MGKSPDERKARRTQLETEFVNNVEQVLGFYLVPWQKRVLLSVRRATLEGTTIDVKAMVEAERRNA